MKHKCFISFKTEDIKYKQVIQNELNIDMIDNSLNEAIDSEDEDTILRKIREEYLSESTVTLFIIGNSSAENSLFQDQSYIKRELQASLYDGKKNTKNGILGIVLPSMYSKIYTGSGICDICGDSHTHVSINDNSTIKEFSYNYYIPHNKCSWSEDDKYCVLVKWNDFVKEAEAWIDKAFNKRTQPISTKTKVKP